MEQGTIVRSAFGIPLSLGQLYNACAEKPCNLSILTTTSPPPLFIKSIQVPNTDSKYHHVSSVSDKFHSLKVAAELQLSFLAGLVQVSGSGRYFTENKTCARSVSVSLVNKITTVYESLDILDGRFREIINVDAFKHRSATHVVTGITWGANLIVTAEYQNNEKKAAKEIAGSLTASLNTFFINIEASVSADIQTFDTLENSKLNIKIIGDVLIPGPIPHTIEGAVAVVDQISALTKMYNGGKGVPVCYELTALDSIQSYFHMAIKTSNLFHNLQQQTMVRITAVFEEIAVAKMELNEFCEQVSKFQRNLPKDMQSAIRQLKQEAEAAESEFQSQLQILLVQVRSGMAEASQLEALKRQYESGPYSAANVLRKLSDTFKDVQKKMKELESFAAINISVVPGSVRSLPHKLMEFKGKQIYVLFGASEVMKKEEKLWSDHFAAVRMLVEDPKTAEDTSFVFVDLDSTPHLAPEPKGDEKGGICLKLFNKYGKCVDEDVYATFSQKTHVSFAKSANTTRIDTPNYGLTLECLCPESLFCQPHYHKWTCFNCKAQIKWDLDEVLYCSCGVGRIDSYKFRCLNSKRGNDYSKFPSKIMEKVMEIARQPRSDVLEVSELAPSLDYKNLIYRKARHMARPLVEIFKNTLDNLRIAYEHKQQLNVIDLRDSKLEMKLRIPVSTLKVVDLETTRIVCASPSCVKYRKTKQGVFYCEFVKICSGPHNWRVNELPSSSKLVSIFKETDETLEDQKLIRCNSCDCAWSSHMPLRFIVQSVDGFENISLVQEGTYRDMDGESKRGKALTQTGVRIAQLQKELKTIHEACVGIEMLNATSLRDYPFSSFLSWLTENHKENIMMTTEEKNTCYKHLKWFLECQENIRAEVALQVESNRAFGPFGEKYFEDFNKNIEKWYALPINGNIFKKMAEIQGWRWN